jgi:hypothetical protein
VAVLPSSTLPPARTASLMQAVQRAISSARLSLVGAAEIETALQGESALRDCATPTCTERLGRLLGATAVLRFSAEAPAEGGSRASYQLQIELFNVEVGAAAASQNSTCASCTVSEVGQSLAELTRQVLAADAARPRGTLAIDTTPPSAAVFVDGNESGLTPYQRPAYVGPHTVILRATGYRPHETSVTIREQQQSHLGVLLLAGEAAPALAAVAAPEGAGRPQYKKWWFWTILGGVAVAAAVTTGVVVSQNSGPATPAQSANHISF